MLTSVVSSTLTPAEPVAVEASATPRAELTSIDAISADHVGHEVTVQGTIVDAESFSQGFRVTLDDRGAQLVLLMWHDVYDNCSCRLQIKVGARVQASGEVTQYEGQLQIEPRVGGDVKVTQDAGSQVPRREISSISVAASTTSP